MTHLKLKHLLVLFLAAPLIGCPPKGVEQTGPMTSEHSPNIRSKIQFPSPDPTQSLSSAEEGFSFMLESILFGFQPNQSLDDLLSLLLKSKQEPKVYSDFSEQFFENQIVVRTDSPVLGTRYFHGIYLSVDQKLIPSHLSFETNVKFEEALAAIEKIISKEKRITDQSDLDSGNSAWSLTERYRLRAKKLVSDDLIDHPTNAYTKDDIGTVVVSVERLRDL